MPKKKKHATALFEVMSAGKTFEPVVRSRSFFHSPSLKSIFTRPRKAGPPQAVEFPRAAAFSDRDTHYQPAEPAGEEVEKSSRQPREPWLDKFRPIWNELSSKFDVTNAVIAVSGVVIVVGLGVMVFHKFKGAPIPTMVAVNTNDIRKQSLRPDVLDLPRRAEPKAAEIAHPANDVPPVEKPVSSGPAKRIINMNYLMIQSYQDEKVSHEAADLLNSRGVECTVIQGLTRWSPSPRWFCVVGTKGFAPRTTESAEFQTT